MSSAERIGTSRDDQEIDHDLVRSSSVEETVCLNSEADINYEEPTSAHSQELTTAEFRDYQGNIYTVSMDALRAAGIDTDHLTDLSEEQLNTVMSLASSSSDPIVTEETDSELGRKRQKQAEEEAEDYDLQTITISIMPDESLKLYSSNGTECYFSASQLAQVNIDTSNLSDEDIKRLVNHANSIGNDAIKAEEKKRRKLEAAPVSRPARVTTPSTSRVTIPPGHSSRVTSFPSSSKAVTPSQYEQLHSVGSLATEKVTRRSHPLPMTSRSIIGETVHIKKLNNKVVPAIVRYSRPGSGYKVQFPDGRFEWISADKIVSRTSRHTDHQGYASSAVSAVSERALPPAPVLHASHSRIPTSERLPNFCCPICDRKVYQKEPSFIVIRLPACDSCTREKILIVDDGKDQHPPQEMVYSQESFEAETKKEIAAMSSLPPESLRLNKILLRDVHRHQFTKANNVSSFLNFPAKAEVDLIVQRWQSKECANAIGAFLSKKK